MGTTPLSAHGPRRNGSRHSRRATCRKDIVRHRGVVDRERFHRRRPLPRRTPENHDAGAPPLKDSQRGGETVSTGAHLPPSLLRSFGGLVFSPAEALAKAGWRAVIFSLPHSLIVILLYVA